jgi:hypothetical protein
MRRCPEAVVLLVAVIALVGCGTSPTAPGQPTAPGPTSPPQFDPTALFARVAGPYTLTFEADESCPLPPSLKVLTYDVLVQPTRFRYLAVLAPGRPVVGDLWVLATEDQGFTFRWNVDCEGPDSIGSTSFYLCGQGAAFVNGATISGVFQGANVYLDMNRRPLCANASHRFTFRPRTLQ